MKILVIGDAILDKYTEVVSTRMSPENPDVKVYDVVNEYTKPGGALNVAANLASLTGFPVHLSAIISQENADWLEREYNVHQVQELCSPTDEPLIKDRVSDLSANAQVCRIDHRQWFSSNSREWFKRKFEQNAELLQAFDCIVVSDYNKGTVEQPVLDALKQAHCPVFVDTKQVDLAKWAGIPECVVKINTPEHARCENASKVSHLIVTRGSYGASYHHGGRARDLLGSPVENADSVGAGDTYLAGLVDGYVYHGLSIHEAMRHADRVARASVRKKGTSIVTPTDLEKELRHDDHGHAR